MYAFLRIISEGRLYGADGDLNKKDDLYYDVLRIIRQEDTDALDYVISDDGKTAEIRFKEKLLLSVERTVFAQEADYLLDAIKSSIGPSFSSERTEAFMSTIKCFKIKAPSSDKSDITVQIHDFRTGIEPVLGFSIKSRLGRPATLLNAGKTTNFVFKLIGPVDYFADQTGQVDLDREGSVSTVLFEEGYQNLDSNGIDLVFIGLDSETFESNLSLIDSRMSEIVAEMLKLRYINGIKSVELQVLELERTNPLGFMESSVHQIYRYKIKKLLTAIALGMKPATVWDGREEANGGYIVVKDDGEVLCYHIYNRNDFEDYLLKNTNLEIASRTRHEFSKIYDFDGEFYIKLNLQIRFK